MIETNMKTRIYVWDWPLRLFHWLLVISIGAAYLTQEFDLMVWHQRIGLTILGLLVFRIVWGFVGTRHARFADFLRGPAGVLAYLRGNWRGLGHNPLGGWSVMMLLLLPFGMAASGLFANDDVTFTGLLSGWLDKDGSDQATSLHHLGFNLLLGMIALHLVAIIFFRWKKRTDLLRPMLTGWKPGDTTTQTTTHTTSQTQTAVRQGGGVLALVFSLSLAALTVFSVTTLEPPPVVSVPAETPDW